MFTTLKRRLSNSGEFYNRILNRSRNYWEVPNADMIRNQRMFATDDLSEWKDAQHWQRKLSNKANAKEFAMKNNCKVAELYWRGADADTIDFSVLPSHYVIRPTIGHSSGMVYVMENGTNLFDKKVYSHEQIRENLRTALVENPHLEFLIEEFLKNEQGNYGILVDYKFFCFNGEIAAVGVIERRSPNSGDESFVDENWNVLPRITIAYSVPKALPEQPACWDEMVAKVKELSKVYEIFVRLDFYATDKGAVFGEFTPTPGMGRNYTPFGKKLLLEYWDKYCKDTL